MRSLVECLRDCKKDYSVDTLLRHDAADRIAELEAIVSLHQVIEANHKATIERVREEVNQIDEAFKCRDSCSREAFRNIRSIVIALSKALEQKS